MSIPTSGLDLTMLSIFSIQPLQKHRVDFFTNVTAHNVIDMEPYGVLLASNNSIRNTWVVGVEDKTNVFKVFAECAIPQ